MVGWSIKDAHRYGKLPEIYWIRKTRWISTFVYEDSDQNIVWQYCETPLVKYNPKTKELTLDIGHCYGSYLYPSITSRITKILYEYFGIAQAWIWSIRRKNAHYAINLPITVYGERRYYRFHNGFTIENAECKFDLHPDALRWGKARYVAKFDTSTNVQTREMQIPISGRTPNTTKETRW